MKSGLNPLAPLRDPVVAYQRLANCCVLSAAVSEGFEAKVIGSSSQQFVQITLLLLSINEVHMTHKKDTVSKTLTERLASSFAVGTVVHNDST